VPAINRNGFRDGEIKYPEKKRLLAVNWTQILLYISRRGGLSLFSGEDIERNKQLVSDRAGAQGLRLSLSFLLVPHGLGPLGKIVRQDSRLKTELE
jgi:hypothetical protein